MQSYLSAIIAIILVLFLPGISIHIWLPRKSSSIAGLVSIIGTSISLVSLILLLSSYFSFRITDTLILILYLACLLSCVSKLILFRFKFKWSSDLSITIGLLTGVLLFRFYQIRGIVLPPWVDSIHHVLITKVILENGAVPGTLAPYLSVPFSYYFGFHGVAALISHLGNLPIEKTILILGQVLNACVPLAIFRLGYAIWNDRTKALIAALLVAFFSQMPAYYVTWGRYTLLIGMIMLALAMAELIEANRDEFKAGNYGILVLTVIGLALSHYFSLVLFVVFLSLYLPYIYFTSGRHLTSANKKSMLAILLAFILLAPWLIQAYRLSGYNTVFNLFLPKTSDGWQSIQTNAEYLFKLAGPPRNYVFLGLGILGLIPSLSNRNSRILGIWGLIILIAALPAGLKLPNIRPDHMIIVLFLPLSLSAAYLICYLGDSIAKHFRQEKVRAAILSIPIIGLCIWGIWDTRSIINPATILATKADITAIQWINDHVDPDARFLINAVTWQNAIYRGVDGGYWLLPLTGRFTIPPPVIFTWGDKATTRSINSMAKSISEVKTCDAAFWTIIADGKFTHLYIKDGVGSMQKEAFNTCPGIKRIYSSEGVTVYQIDRNGY
jgi:hypothetical protein